MNFLSLHEVRLAIALAAGMLIGAQRERQQPTRADTFAGLRTFGLVGLLGGLFASTGQPALLAVGAGVIGLTALAAYVVQRDAADSGATTEIALVVTYALGALALSEPILAASASVIVTVLLGAKEPMHKLVRETLTKEELRDALVFLLFALVLLPSVPDVHVGPYGAIHPPSLVRLILVLMAVAGAGHVARRLVGSRYGLAVTGFAGGFVSSSATIAAFSLQAREHGPSWRSAACGALASNISTVIQYALILTAVDPALALRVAPALAMAGAVALTLTLSFTRLASRQPPLVGPQGRAFRLWAALGLAFMVSLVSILSEALHEHAGRMGIVIVSAAAALVDAHSTAGSVAALHKSAAIDGQTATLAILVALSANTLTKILLAWSGRHMKFGISVTMGALLVAGGAWLGMWLGP
jgi:uncharacterized membrane protein (DUF4010 family)